ncbi:MAG: hypothetical protein WA705_17000 [Candidatus Ozemobacteraceae bacterium]
MKSFWGLEPLLWLVSVGTLTQEAALASAEAIRSSNPRFITASIVRGFSDKLRSL